MRTYRWAIYSIRYRKAMKLSGYKTKRETVEAALELLVRLKSQEAIRAARGKLRWEGNLDAMRSDR